MYDYTVVIISGRRSSALATIYAVRWTAASTSLGVTYIVLIEGAISSSISARLSFSVIESMTSFIVPIMSDPANAFVKLTIASCTIVAASITVGIPTAITQNVKDLLSSREVENIFENSDFVLMLNQAQGDREILARQLNISPQQMKYVTHTEAGEGLIFYGNVVLPFLDRFPQNTELYRVMTTRPEEVGGT